MKIYQLSCSDEKHFLAKKRERAEDFDVPMGCYDSAEVCEIAGSYMLTLLRNILDIDLAGVYRELVN